ncbi:RagB/SusD family nutrient uptake outer membrane protein [Flavihumibacter profundi]|uniref:RagB/SusD family nutrient uptake outer membrane protein n=1 Tax=Flavihumibacter profundi TaxID=2716883 RepID=UPI001CC7559D|nr:RagB/SusD family nutrient uptake outer membrane protein [Flavihumibacter profundi]MBZ5856090.1 RagB/SusD family nutrient uptake outer membrane protein [Flavihumibacter profundi]
MSCNKLTEEPSSIIVSDQFYKTQSDAVAAVSAVYSTLNSDPAGDFPLYGRNLNLLIGNGSDDQVYSPSNTNPDVRALGTTTYVASNDRVRKNWQQHYYGISKANIAIDNIPNIHFDETLRNRLVNEAKFIRALLYFNLVRLHGDVPLILHDPTTVDVNSLKVARTPLNEVYSQIIADLTDATNLPKSYTGADKGRVTSGAAHALLAKVYVTRKDWTNAKLELESVLTTGTFPNATGSYGYDLFANYRDAFQKPTKNGKEHIFSVQYETNLGAKNSANFLSSGDFNSYNPAVYAGDLPDERLVAIFDTTDTRRAVSFFNKLFNPANNTIVDFGAVTHFGKFIDFTLNPLTNQGQSGVNFPVLRYADILLLYAETLNEISGPTADAYAAINKVRTRAYGGVAHDLAPELSQAEFRDAVFLERRKEFVQEANRWFDLVRSGTLVEALKKIPAKEPNVSDKNYLYPIPQVEIDLNPLLKQNPGW